METADYLAYIVKEIHSTAAATVDDEGLPVTCAIDIMDCDENSLYFLTAKGKSFYRRLKKQNFIACTGMRGTDTLSCTAVSVRGYVREIGAEKLPDLFEKNPYMNTIYPDSGTRTALTVFQIWKGTGEWFDLSRQPVERAEFAFGGAEKKESGYFITDKCTGCRLCYPKCPQKCIDVSVRPARIRQENCLRCGNCLEVCPAGAVERRADS